MIRNVKCLLWFIERGNIKPNDALVKEFDLEYCLKDGKLTNYGKAVIKGPYHGNAFDLIRAKLSMKSIKSWHSFIDLLEIAYPDKNADFDYETLNMLKSSHIAKFRRDHYVILDWDGKCTYNKIFNNIYNYFNRD